MGLILLSFCTVNDRTVNEDVFEGYFYFVTKLRLCACTPPGEDGCSCSLDVIRAHSLATGSRRKKALQAVSPYKCSGNSVNNEGSHRGGGHMRQSASPHWLLVCACGCRQVVLTVWEVPLIC